MIGIFPPSGPGKLKFQHLSSYRCGYICQLRQPTVLLLGNKTMDMMLILMLQGNSVEYVRTDAGRVADSRFD